MSVVSLLGVKILNNPATFTASYQFEITFECLEQLQKGMIVILSWGKKKRINKQPLLTINP